MTNDTPKPREFWITDGWSDDCSKLHISPTYQVAANDIHVIEYSAFAALAEALRKISQFYVSLDGSMGGSAVKIAREALKKAGIE